MSARVYSSVEEARAAAAKAISQERKRGSKRSRVASGYPTATPADVENARERVSRLAATLDQ